MWLKESENKTNQDMLLMNPNKKPVSKQRLSQQLETIVNNITRRGIYVVKKQSVGYCIQEYLTSNQVVDGLPDTHIAHQLCDRYNQGKYLTVPQLKKLNDLLAQYQKNKTDLMFFQNTLYNSRDSVLLAATTFRYEKTHGLMYRLLEQIEKI
jgi:hypothetical protein